MDYVFFAFSALCVGFAIVMAFLLAARKILQPRPRLLLLAAFVGVLYYYLVVTYLFHDMIAYYLANLVPQVVLAILLSLYLLRRNEE